MTDVAKESERLVSIHRRPKSSMAASSDRIASRKLPPPTRENPLIISVSELRDFMRCRVMWHLRHQVRVEPKQGSEALSMGTLGHLILEDWYGLATSKRTVKAMARIAQEHIKKTTLRALNGDARQLIEAMVVGYARWTLDPENEIGDKAIGYDKGAPEEWFNFPLTDDESILLRGKLDNRFQSTTMKKTMALLEFKTASSIQMSKFETNLQITGYLCGLRYKFPNFKRYVVYPTVLRKQMPGPRVKADLFARQMEERTHDEMDIWIADARRAALDMYDAAIYASPMDSCAWGCDYRNPCLVRGTPSDMKYILKTEYQERTRT